MGGKGGDDGDLELNSRALSNTVGGCADSGKGMPENAEWDPLVNMENL